MKNLTKHYGILTPDERLKAALDAMARGDWQEAGTFGATCPKVQYAAQRDLSFTGKFQSLQVMTLLHAVSFNQALYSIVVAMYTQDTRAYSLRYAELMAFTGAWKRFCDYAGFDPDTVLRAFGLELDPARMHDLPAGDIDPNEAMIDEIYQGHLRNWA